MFLMVVVLMATSCKDDPDPLPPFIARTIFITSAEITEWPKVQPDGTGWDLTSAPDVTLSMDDGTTILFQSSVSDNSTQATFNYPVAKTITDFTKQHAVGLWDEDSPDDDDLMAFYTFTIKSYVPTNSNPQRTDYPSVLEFNTKVGFKVKLNVIWQE